MFTMHQHSPLWRHIRGFLLVLPIALLSACGGGTSTTGGTTTGGTTTPTLSLLAGSMGGSGNADGTGAVASFASPQGITTDSAGNMYVVDASNHTIRKITSAGVVTTLAGTPGSRGSADGTGAAARFYYPDGITTDSAGNVYVADTYNHTIRKITSAGVVTTLAGTARSSGSADGTGAAARFYYPQGITTDSAGNMYVADRYNYTIRKITSAGVVTTLAGTAGSSGSADGTGAAASFASPKGITTDSAGNVYVADANNHTIRKITSAGVVTTLAGTVGSYGSADGTGAAASFNYPQGITTDSAGNLYVADTSNSIIRKITSAGVVSTFAGAVWATGSADGTGAAASFNNTFGTATDSAGNVYVADSGNHTIRKITSAGVVTTLAGLANNPGSADGTGAAASFNYPQGITTDSAGNVYVADYYNHTIRKITSAGVVTTLAGTARSYGSADGTGAAARFNYPGGLATDSAGNVYVADTENHTIRKITSAGVVTTLAGTVGSSDSADGTGAAASFSYPYGLATDSAGNVYVADTNNSTIRKITSAGVVTTLAGLANNPGSADGTGAAASFNYPYGITTDSAGNLYVADTSSNTIRKIITATGLVSTVVGTAGRDGFTAGADLPGIIRAPYGVAVYQTTLYFTGANGVAKVSSVP
jgi:sugar lactone lactonase YvrE